MKSQENRTSKRFVKELTLIQVQQTERANRYIFEDDELNIFTHDQVPVKDAMDYGGLKAASKAAKWFKAMKHKKIGDKVKCACVIREMNDAAFSEYDKAPHVYRNVEEIL